MLYTSKATERRELQAESVPVVAGELHELVVALTPPPPARVRRSRASRLRIRAGLRRREAVARSLSRRLAETLRGLLDASAERLGALRAEPRGVTREDFATLLGLPKEEPGGDPPDEAETQLLLARATIDELRTSLEQLQPLGEQLGEVERARLDLLEELERMRRDPAPPDPDPDPDPEAELRAKLDSARKELTKRDRRIATLEDRLTRMRSRYDERHRKASERWHELVDLRRRLRELGEEDRAAAAESPPTADGAASGAGPMTPRRSA